MDTSVSKFLQLDAAIPISTISSLSSGEFVGFVADNPDQQIDLKGFHSKFVNVKNTVKKNQTRQTEMPVIRNVNPSIIQRNYLQIKRDVEDIFETEMAGIMRDPSLRYFMIKKASS